MKNFRIISRLEIKSGPVIKGLRMEGLRKIDFPENIIKDLGDHRLVKLKTTNTRYGIFTL